MAAYKGSADALKALADGGANLDTPDKVKGDS